MSAASIQSSSASRLMNDVAKNNQQCFAYLVDPPPVCFFVLVPNPLIATLKYSNPNSMAHSYVPPLLVSDVRHSQIKSENSANYTCPSLVRHMKKCVCYYCGCWAPPLSTVFPIFYGLHIHIEIGLHQCTMHIDRSASLRFDTAGNPFLIIDGPGMLARCLLMNLSSFTTTTEALKPFHFWHVCCV